MLSILSILFFFFMLLLLLLCRPFCTRFSFAWTRARSSSRSLYGRQRSKRIQFGFQADFHMSYCVLERQTKRRKWTAKRKKKLRDRCERTQLGEGKSFVNQHHISMCTHNFPREQKKEKEEEATHELSNSNLLFDGVFFWCSLRLMNYSRHRRRQWQRAMVVAEQECER